MKKIALIVLSITFSLIIVEILLRITGYKPWKNYETNQNIIFEPIKNLGWKSKKGTYTISAGNTNNKSEISIGEKGNRLNQEPIKANLIDTIKFKTQQNKSIFPLLFNFAQGVMNELFLQNDSILKMLLCPKFFVCNIYYQTIVK